MLKCKDCGVQIDFKDMCYTNFERCMHGICHSCDKEFVITLNYDGDLKCSSYSKRHKDEKGE